MRPDQRARLDELNELLTEEFLNEADPREWPGAGAPPTSWTQQQRGDRVWTKRNAVATGAVLRALADLEDRHMKNLTPNAERQDARDLDLDRHIGLYEDKAKKMLETVQAALKK